MKHKEKMKKLKKTDPIAYYELNSNPVGTDDDTPLFLIIISMMIIGVAIGWIIFLGLILMLR